MRRCAVWAIGLVLALAWGMIEAAAPPVLHDGEDTEYRLVEITFRGNAVLSSHVLRKRLSGDTAKRTGSCFVFPASGDMAEPGTQATIRVWKQVRHKWVAALVEAYHGYGFFGMKVEPEFRFQERSAREFSVCFHISEGKPYRVRNTPKVSWLHCPHPCVLPRQPVMHVRAGQVYSPEDVGGGSGTVEAALLEPN